MARGVGTVAVLFLACVPWLVGCAQTEATSPGSATFDPLPVTSGSPVESVGTGSFVPLSTPAASPPPLESAPILKGTTVPWSRYSAMLSSQGVPMDLLYAQDQVFTDVKQDLPFAQPGDAGDIAEVRLEAANVLADSYLTFQYRGDSCLLPIGGHLAVGADGRVDVHFYAGQKRAPVECLARAYEYRVTLLVPGAKENAPVISTQGTVPQGVTPPLTRDLPALLITPAELPAWPRP